MHACRRYRYVFVWTLVSEAYAHCNAQRFAAFGAAVWSGSLIGFLLLCYDLLEQQELRLWFVGTLIVRLLCMRVWKPMPSLLDAYPRSAYDYSGMSIRSVIPRMFHLL